MLFYAYYRSTANRTPHDDITNPVQKRSKENHDDVEAEDGELPLSSQDAILPRTGVSEFEGAWAVHDMTKKNDEKRKKELADKKASDLALQAQPYSSNIIINAAATPKGKNVKGKGKGKGNGKVAS